MAMSVVSHHVRPSSTDRPRSAYSKNHQQSISHPRGAMTPSKKLPTSNNFSRTQFVGLESNVRNGSCLETKSVAFNTINQNLCDYNALKDRIDALKKKYN
jgi:hypothetical protein